MKRLITLVLLIVLSGCYAAPPEALDLVDKSIVAAKGMHNDPHQELTEIGRKAWLAEHDNLQKIRKMVWGVDVEPEVQARTDARATTDRIRAVETNTEVGGP